MGYLQKFKKQMTMATITEDYVSFETAKLLKEKGFDVPCNCYGTYNAVNLNYRLCITDKYTNWNKHTNKIIISCPTLQMAMKWLREVYNIMVSPYALSLGYYFEIFDLTNGDITGCKPLYKVGIPYKEDISPTYEQAIEAGIKYCLENLI